MNDIISNWILETLSVKHPAFNNMPPCPYAKKALLDGNVKVLEVTDFEEQFDQHKDVEKGHVVVFLFNPTDITPEELTALAGTYAICQASHGVRYKNLLK